MATTTRQERNLIYASHLNFRWAVWAMTITPVTTTNSEHNLIYSALPSIHTSTLTMTSWDNARRHARALESALDTKLASYSRLAADIAGGVGSRAGGSGGGGPSRDVLDAEEGVGGYKLVEEEIEELLGKVSVVAGC